MADERRTPRDPLRSGADLTPRARDFYQTLRRLECAHRDVPRIGKAPLPVEEPVRLGQAPRLAFEGASVVAQETREDHATRIDVSFFGVFGPQGPLPTHLTEYAYQRGHNHRDPTLGRFADVFHHRLLSLFYRAWADARPSVSHDRPDEDRFVRYLGALAGQETRARGAAPDALDWPGMRNAGHMAGRTRHAEGLIKLLGEFFGVPVALEEFVGEWLQIPDAYCWRMSAQAPAVGRAMGVLGETSRIGTEVYERQFKFRLVLGPLKRAVYERFLPGGDHLASLRELVGRYAGPELAWDVRLVLDEPDLQPAIVGRIGALGRTAHLGGRQTADDRGWQDIVLDPLAEAG